MRSMESYDTQKKLGSDLDPKLDAIEALITDLLDGAAFTRAMALINEIREYDVKIRGAAVDALEQVETMEQELLEAKYESQENEEELWHLRRQIQDMEN